MKVSVNNNKMNFESSLYLEELIAKLDLEAKNIAVEINKIIIPRSEYKQCCIKENDQIEIINAVGGG